MSLEATIQLAEGQLRTGASAEALVSIVESAAVAGPAGLPLLAALVDGPCPTALAQALSFVLAGDEEIPSESRILVGSWLALSEGALSDEVTATNLLTWAGRAPFASHGVSALLRRALADLFLACAGSPNASVKVSLLDTLVGASDLTRIALIRDAGEEMLRRLAPLSEQDDELTSSDLEQLDATVKQLARQAVAESKEDSSIEGLLEAIRLDARVQGLTQRTHRSLITWLTEQRVLDSSIRHVEKTHRPLFEFKFLRDVPSLRALGEVATAFDGLLSAVSIPLGHSVSFQPLVASRGSFSLRATLDDDAVANGALTEMMRVLHSTQSPDDLASTLRDRQEVARRFKAWLDVVARQSQTLRTTVIRPGFNEWRDGLRTTPETASTCGAFLQLETMHQGEQVSRTGILIAADLNRRTFTARLNGEDIDGEAPSELLDKATVGDAYEFDLRFTVFEKLTGRVERWILAALERPESATAEEIAAGTVQGALRTGDVPQANLAKIYTLMAVLGKGQVPTPAALGVKHRRNVDYYIAGARILGLVDRDQKPSVFGRMWLRMEDDERAQRLAFKFEESKVAQSWVYWSATLRLADVDPSSAEQFLSETTNLREGTLATRAGCLRAWLKAFKKHLEG